MTDYEADTTLDEEKLHDFLIKVASTQLGIPLDRGMVKINEDEYSSIFSPEAKTLEVRHRKVNVGWIYNTTTKETLLRLSVQLAPVPQKQTKSAWGKAEPKIDLVE